MQKIKYLTLFLWLFFSFSLVFSARTMAATCDFSKPPSGSCACPKGYAHPDGNTDRCSQILSGTDCPSGDTLKGDATKCAPLGAGCASGDSSDACLTKNPITSRINGFINVLSGAVVIVVIAMIIVGGIQYSIAGDNSGAIQAARQRITNGLIALFVFIFIFAFLQWVVPGGL